MKIKESPNPKCQQIEVGELDNGAFVAFLKMPPKRPTFIEAYAIGSTASEAIQKLEETILNQPSDRTQPPEKIPGIPVQFCTADGRQVEETKFVLLQQIPNMGWECKPYADDFTKLGIEPTFGKDIEEACALMSKKMQKALEGLEDFFSKKLKK